MNIKLQIILAVVIVATILYILNLIRTHRVEIKYVLIWLCVCVGMLIIDAFPPIINWVTSAVGVALPINALILIGMGFMMAIAFSLTVVISNLTRCCKRLTQEAALLEARVEKLEQLLDEGSSPSA